MAWQSKVCIDWPSKVEGSGLMQGPRESKSVGSRLAGEGTAGKPVVFCAMVSLRPHGSGGRVRASIEGRELGCERWAI